MKITELQIFDWVKIPDTRSPYRRIWAIEYPFNDSVYVDDYGSPDTDDNYYICDIKPIPLTPEILEKNFGNVGSNDIPCTSILVNGNFYSEMIKFVHELQHALRLCGLEELADNFKI